MSAAGAREHSQHYTKVFPAASLGSAAERGLKTALRGGMAECTNGSAGAVRLPVKVSLSTAETCT